MQPDLLSVARWFAGLIADEQAKRAAPASGSADDWLSIKATPEPRATRAAIQRGQLPAFKVGKKLLIRRSDLDGWISAHPHPATAAPAANDADPGDPIDRGLATGRLRRIGGTR